jgi:hypothetical protein
LIEEAKVNPFVAKEEPQEIIAETNEPKDESPDAGIGEENEFGAGTVREDEGTAETGAVEKSDE